MQHETISVTLLQNHPLKSRKRREVFDDEINYDYQNKKRSAFQKET